MAKVNKWPERTMAVLRGKIETNAVPISDWKAQSEPQGGYAEKVMPEPVWLDLRNLKLEGNEEYLTDEFKAAAAGRKSRYTVTGSQAGTVCGVNPYMSVRELYDRKLGITPDVPAPMNEDALERGKFSEDFVVERAEMLLNELYGAANVKVFTDKRMFMSRDPDRDFMVVNPDAFAAVRYHGGWHLWHIEAKTNASFDAGAHELWREGKPPMHYILQTRHEMAVLGCEACLLVCCWGLARDELGYRIILRDEVTEMDGDMSEEELVEAERQFVGMLENGIIPDDSLNPMTAESYYGRLWDSARRDVELPDEVLPIIEAYMDLKEEKIELDRRQAELEKRMAAQLVKLYPYMEDADRGHMVV